MHASERPAASVSCDPQPFPCSRHVSSVTRTTQCAVGMCVKHTGPGAGRVNLLPLELLVPGQHEKGRGGCGAGIGGLSLLCPCASPLPVVSALNLRCLVLWPKSR